MPRALPLRDSSVIQMNVAKSPSARTYCRAQMGNQTALRSQEQGRAAHTINGSDQAGRADTMAGICTRPRHAAAKRAIGHNRTHICSSHGRAAGHAASSQSVAGQICAVARPRQPGAIDQRGCSTSAEMVGRSISLEDQIDGRTAHGTEN